LAIHSPTFAEAANPTVGGSLHDIAFRLIALAQGTMGMKQKPDNGWNTLPGWNPAQSR
jgi:hypothetical protein